MVNPTDVPCDSRHSRFDAGKPDRTMFKFTCLVGILVLISVGLFVGKSYVSNDLFTFPDLEIKFQEVLPSENTTRHYKELMNERLVIPISKYAWFFRAAFCGLGTMVFAWLIIYKDSYIPGINPPSPFNTLKRWSYQEDEGIPLNYFVATLNGLLVFVYMCL